MGVQRAADPSGVDAILPLRRSTQGVSASFLVHAGDGRDYWCKAINNPASPRVPTNEQLAARVGLLLGVAVCVPQLVRLDGIAGWEFRPGLFVQPGWAHGSLALDPAIETRSLDHRGDDDNHRRHAGFYALMDWLHGGDSQWLYAPNDQNAYSSHDHGHFFPGGPNWTIDLLNQHRDIAAAVGFPAAGLDPQELERLAANLEAITAAQIEAEVAKIPAGWPVTDAELDAMVDFLDHRRAPAARRLRTLLP
jgi:hypothetical protein